MKVLFLDDGRLSYTPDTPYQQPLGGAESTLAYLSEAMAARGHEVGLISKAPAQDDACRGVKILGPQAATARVMNQYDAVIVATRGIGQLFRKGGVRIPMISWQHQAPTTQWARPFEQLEERDAWSQVVFVSDDQRQAFGRRFGLDGVVIRNAAAPGVINTPFEPSCFLDRDEDPVLIYASGPGHGMELLLTSFAALRERLPGARLLICADEGIYQVSSQEDPYSSVYALARALPGVEFTGAMSQDDLGRQYARADILAYPTNFVETSCIVAIEAAVSGCLFAGTDLGALRETMAGYGVFMTYEDSRTHVSKGFPVLVEQAVRAARADPAAYKQRRAEQSAMFRQTHTWARRAEEWEALLDKTVSGAGRR